MSEAPILTIDEKTRISIASKCGWVEITKGKFSGLLFGNAPNGEEDIEIPDYLNDLNAMHDAEMCLSDISPGKDTKGDQMPSDRARYRMNLCIVTMCNGGPIHATARQKAQAFLLTINIC